MIIDGKAIADDILIRLTDEVAALKSDDVTPTMAVIQIGDDPASLAYIRQKQKAAERIGAKILISNSISDVELFNTDPKIHGLIVQRPVPQSVGEYHVTPNKDIDGFEQNSPFDVPVAVAVGEMLKIVFSSVIPAKAGIQDSSDDNFMNWLQSKNIVVIGRGETAGKPINNYLNRLLATSADIATKSSSFATSPKERRDSSHCTTSVITSKTPNPKEIMKQADVIISCVGKSRIVTPDAIKAGAILVSVGIWRDESGKLHGDYEPEDIAETASWYTPTPGGVGPVNVACLMQNLIKACTLK